MTRLLIVGAGAAGLSAAVWADRLGLEAMVFEAGPAPGGQLLDVDAPYPDYLGLPDGDGAALARAFVRHARRTRTAIRAGQPVARLDVAGRCLHMADGQAVTGDAFLLATGARVTTLGIPGEARLLRRGVNLSTPIGGPPLGVRRAVVVGAGDSAYETALALAAGGCRVVMIQRGPGRARADFLKPIEDHPLVQVRVGARLVEILGQDRVCAVRLDGGAGGAVEELGCEAVYIRIGVQPRSGLVQGQAALDPQGYVLVGPDQATSAPGLWAAGDVCNPLTPSVAAAAGQAMVAVKQVQLRGRA